MSDPYLDGDGEEPPTLTVEDQELGQVWADEVLRTTMLREFGKELAGLTGDAFNFRLTRGGELEVELTYFGLKVECTRYLYNPSTVQNMRNRSESLATLVATGMTVLLISRLQLLGAFD